jgi:DNA-binding NtrC family response regulator
MMNLFFYTKPRHILNLWNVMWMLLSQVDRHFKTITANIYDAMVSDYQMPVMDGHKLLKESRSRDNNLPFLLFTGRGREDVAIEALDNGVDF